jgi:hypothetical protein
MSHEPDYLRRLREARAQRRKGSAGRAEVPSAIEKGLSVAEQEAIRWAREVAAGQDIRSIRGLAGTRFAVLVRLQSATGQRFLSLDGLPDREALRERVKPGATVGEEVLGAYEVKGGRPVTVELEEGQVVLRMGPPRPGARPLDPEQMLRKAKAEAALRARQRPSRDRDRR